MMAAMPKPKQKVVSDMGGRVSVAGSAAVKPQAEGKGVKAAED